jgi:GntR family transcriptional regulator, transcriptional repressor for pyruvate dehydrogenase complex
MNTVLKPIKAESLQDVFIARFEELILSGKLAIGEKLPSERELSMQLGVSRPVVHKGLLELEFRGLIALKARSGAVVNDYRREGSLALLNSIFRYHQGALTPDLLRGLLEMRMLFEVEIAGKAADHRENEHLEVLAEILTQEREAGEITAEARTRLDFQFHQQVALASGNPIYPLMLNSFEQVYLNLASQFYGDPQVHEWVVNVHERLYGALKRKDMKAAKRAMRDLLEHGERSLERMLESQK